MAIKQKNAVAFLNEAAGKIIEVSLCEVMAGYLALVQTEAGKRLAYVTEEENQLTSLFKSESVVDKGSAKIYIMPLNAHNAALVRRIVKWTAPSACGTKGLSLGFSDWLGAADAFVTELFAKKQIKPVLVEYTPEDSIALKRNFLEAVDTATWGVLEAGYREGYGANAAGLKSEEEIVKALLYGYSMIGFDCSDKIDLSIEKLSDESVAKKFNEFNETFKDAVNASYLNVEFQVGKDKISFTEAELHRIVLEFGEAIMHVQFIYNSYLKNTPWDIDFELSLSKPGKALTPTEHYLIANELQRNGIKLSSICMDALKDGEALNENLLLHCEIADTFGYRISFANADAGLEDPAAAIKALKGKAHLKLNNVTFCTGLGLVAEKNPELMGKVAAAIDLKPEDFTTNCKAFALGYKKILNPAEGNLAGEIKKVLQENREDYKNILNTKVASIIKNL